MNKIESYKNISSQNESDKDKYIEHEIYHLVKAQEIGSIGTWELDLVKNVLWWTKESHNIFSIPDGIDLTYETFLEYVHPGDREYVNTEWKAAINGKPYDIEHRIIVNGKIKWVREKAELTLGNNGKPISAVGVTQDITKKKLTEKNLKLNEARLDSLLQLSRMKEASLKEIAEFARERSIALTESEIGFLGFMSEDESEMLIHAWSKEAMEACEIQNKPINFPLNDAGIWGDCIRERKPVIINESALKTRF